jgi:hypothetical protein
MDRKRFPRGKGWYTDVGYCEADILEFPPVAPIANWAPTIQALWHGAGEDAKTTSYTVSIDADAHAGIPGTVLAKGTGQLQPRVFNLSGLAPGQHKLAIKADCNAPTGSTNSGVLKFTFDVPGDTPPPPPPPPPPTDAARIIAASLKSTMGQPIAARAADIVSDLDLDASKQPIVLASLKSTKTQQRPARVSAIVAALGL